MDHPPTDAWIQANENAIEAPTSSSEEFEDSIIRSILKAPVAVAIFILIILATTAWILSRIAFACGFLIVVGLRFSEYDSHKRSKNNLNSLPLSYTIL